LAGTEEELAGDHGFIPSNPYLDVLHFKVPGGVMPSTGGVIFWKRGLFFLLSARENRACIASLDF